MHLHKRWHREVYLPLFSIAEQNFWFFIECRPIYSRKRCTVMIGWTTYFIVCVKCFHTDLILTKQDGFIDVPYILKPDMTTWNLTKCVSTFFLCNEKLNLLSVNYISVFTISKLLTLHRHQTQTDFKVL